MNRVICLALLIVFCIFGCCKTVPKETDVYYLPDCKPIVKYSATTFSIKGIEIPLSSVPIKIGEVTWDPKLLQQAHVTTQILDMHRVATCEKLPTYASMGTEEFKKHMDEMSNDDTRLTQLALLVASGNQEGVKKWVEVYSPRAYAVATTEVVNKVTKLPSTMEPQSIEAQLKGLKTQGGAIAQGSIGSAKVVPLESLMK